MEVVQVSTFDRVKKVVVDQLEVGEDEVTPVHALWSQRRADAFIPNP